MLHSPFRLALIDDHAVVRAGVRRLIELKTGFTVVAEIDDGESIVDALPQQQLHVDMLVLDLWLPGNSGPALLRRILDAQPALKVLVFTMHNSAAMDRSVGCCKTT